MNKMSELLSELLESSRPKTKMDALEHSAKMKGILELLRTTLALDLERSIHHFIVAHVDTQTLNWREHSQMNAQCWINDDCDDIAFYLAASNYNNLQLITMRNKYNGMQAELPFHIVCMIANVHAFNSFIERVNDIPEETLMFLIKNRDSLEDIIFEHCSQDYHSSVADMLSLD
jgi:hypothetical protein